MQVAAVWTRDGRPWKQVHGLSAEALRQQNAEYGKQSFRPVDVAGYLDRGKENYTALWAQAWGKTETAQMVLEMERASFLGKHYALTKKESNYLAISSFLAGPDGRPRFAAIWEKNPNLPEGLTVSESFDREAKYSGQNHPGDLQVDVFVGKSRPITDTKERRYTLQLQEAEMELQDKPGNANARLKRAEAYFYLGEYEKALTDLSWVLEKSHGEAPAYQFRAVAYARLGKGKEARADLDRFKKLVANLPFSQSSQAYLETVVATYLGEGSEAINRLEGEISANDKQADFLYAAACAYAQASQAAAGRKDARSKTYAERAVVLLKKALAGGSDYQHMLEDADLDPIRQQPGYQALLAAPQLERYCTGVWRSSKTFTSAEVHGFDPVEHLARCRDLINQGYWPVSLSIAGGVVGQPPVTASVWHRPVVFVDPKERLAKRQATSAVILLKMGRADNKVWELFRHRPDPRVRSYLIHRLSSLGVDPDGIVTRLAGEPDVSARRALLLALGEYGEPEFPPGKRDLLIRKLFEYYRDDPDPGLHGAVEWLLRKWGQQDQLGEMTQTWAKDKGERAERLRRIGREAAKDHDREQWYVNGQGQTMVVIPGPVKFLMESTATEVDRSSGYPENHHPMRISRSFAIAASEVTVEQFLSFRKDHGYPYYLSPTKDSPISYVTWYDAAAYCNWLSEQEGMAKDQWCYEPNKEGKYEAGMRMAPNYLHRTGYRLPTEAEWEYACRARGVTSRFYGETEELLGFYALYTKNSLGLKMWPVGSLKPNDLGLFDMLGNALEWCQDQKDAEEHQLGQEGRRVEDVEDDLNIDDKKTRVKRGGSFDRYPGLLRCAARFLNVPDNRGVEVGFRPARTMRLA